MPCAQKLALDRGRVRSKGFSPFRSVTDPPTVTASALPMRGSAHYEPARTCCPLMDRIGGGEARRAHPLRTDSAHPSIHRFATLRMLWDSYDDGRVCSKGFSPFQTLKRTLQAGRGLLPLHGGGLEERVTPQRIPCEQTQRILRYIASRHSGCFGIPTTMEGFVARALALPMRRSARRSRRKTGLLHLN